MKEQLAKVIRICTVAPFMALITLLVLYWQDPTIFAAPFHVLYAIACLVVVPLLAYPVSWIFHTGREKQRRLAVYFSLAGYAALLILCFAFSNTHDEMAIYLTYVGSVVIVAITSRFPKLRASGHACGVAGPAALLVSLLGPAYIPVYLILPAVYWSSLVLKRHTWSQLLLGTVTPILILVGFRIAGFL